MSDKPRTPPRLGAASITISISDSEGLVVRHGSDPDWLLASKPAEECGANDWDTIWATLDSLGCQRHE
jgi:hypothetical protein